MERLVIKCRWLEWNARMEWWECTHPDIDSKNTCESCGPTGPYVSVEYEQEIELVRDATRVGLNHCPKYEPKLIRR